LLRNSSARLLILNEKRGEPGQYLGILHFGHERDWNNDFDI